MVNNKKRVLIILLPVLLVIVSIVILIFGQINANKNQYGDEVVINNYSGLIKNLSKERQDAIFTSLYKTVALNLPNQTVPKINDAVIREGSNTQDEAAGPGRFSGLFIVDIESIKQSYRIVYSYSSTVDDDFMVDYNVVVQCLPVEDLKFGDFGCKDIFTEEDVVTDPVQRVLPRSTLEYSIEFIDVSETNDNNFLQITLYLTDADRYNEQESIETYKNMALEWLVSNNINPDDYTINYIY